MKAKPWNSCLHPSEALTGSFGSSPEKSHESDTIPETDSLNTAPDKQHRKALDVLLITRIGALDRTLYTPCSQACCECALKVPVAYGAKGNGTRYHSWMRKPRAVVLLFPFFCCFSPYWRKMHRLKEKRKRRFEALCPFTKARLYASLIMNSGDI